MADPVVPPPAASSVLPSFEIASRLTAKNAATRVPGSWLQVVPLRGLFPYRTVEEE